MITFGEPPRGGQAVDREATDAGDRGRYVTKQFSRVCVISVGGGPGGGMRRLVADVLDPKKPGNHVKTDSRDAKELLSLFEADY